MFVGKMIVGEEFFKNLPYERIPDFLESSLASQLDPSSMAKILNKKNALVKMRIVLYQKYGNKIRFGFMVPYNEDSSFYDYEIPFLGEKSFFRGFPNRKELEASITEYWKSLTEQKIDSLLRKYVFEKNFPSRDKAYPDWYDIEVNSLYDKADNSLYYMKTALENNILLKGAEGILALIYRIFTQYHSRARSAGYLESNLQTLCKVKQLLISLQKQKIT